MNISINESPFCRVPTHPDADRQRKADYIWNALQALRNDQWLPHAEIERKQVAAARALVAHGLRHVPYYRETFHAAGVDPRQVDTLEAFRSLPVLDRCTFRTRAAEFHAEALPPGMMETGVVSTSGTTGVPIKVQQTNIVNLAWCTFAMRDLEWCGIDPRGSLAAIRNLGVRGAQAGDPSQGKAAATWGRPISDVIETGPSHLLGIDAGFARQRSWLEEINPDYFLSAASNLGTLAAALDSPPRLPALRAIQSFGETLTDEMRRRAEFVFGVPVWDMYTCQEAGYLASQCPTRSGYHVHAENVILEVVDAEGRPCAPGQVGRVLITTLLNYANPLIRYAIADEAVAGGPCACGRGLPVLERVLGKERPLFRLPAGGVKNTSTLASSIAKIAGVQQFQFEQRAPDDIVLRLVPSATWGPDSVAEVAGAVGEFFGSRVRLNVETCARIPPTPAGKLQSFIPMAADPVTP